MCILPKLLIWDFTIKHLVNHRLNPIEECELIFQPRSFIDANGQLWMNASNNEKCFYRCVHPLSDFDLEYDEWTPFENKSEFEVDQKWINSIMNDNNFVKTEELQSLDIFCCFKRCYF